MKVLSDPKTIANINQQKQTQKASVVHKKESFNKILNEKLTKTQSRSSKILEEKNAQNVLPIEVSSLNEVSQSDISLIEDILVTWEKYSHSLAQDTSLRKTYSLLQEIKDKMGAISSEIKNNPHLKEIVKELDVLLTSEEIKFNRGDYL